MIVYQQRCGECNSEHVRVFADSETTQIELHCTGCATITIIRVAAALAVRSSNESPGGLVPHRRARTASR